MGRVRNFLKGPAIAIAITFGFLLNFYTEVILSPNDYLFASSQDGLKAYYVYAYHVKHDTSYHQLDGMNYPFGQTYIYTDGQPAIANTVKAVCSIFPALEHYSIGIYNLLVILSFLAAAWLLFIILRKCNLPELYAGVFAGCITVLSPQFFRLCGHMTLTYTCFFPLLWYLIIRYFETGRKWKYTFWIIFTGTFWAFVHPYYLPAQIFFLAGLYLTHWLFVMENKAAITRHKLLVLAQLIVPIAIIKLYDNLVDIHTGRPENPAGFFDYMANWKTIFLPAYHESYQFVERFIPLPPIERWEGIAYIGMVANIAIVATVILIVIKFIKTKKLQLLPDGVPYNIRIVIIPAVLMLLLAMALPFSLHPRLHKYSEWIPYIRQFRSLGRFAWPFFYVATVYAVWLLYQLFNKQKILGYALATLAVAVFFVEGYYYHKTVVVWQNRGKNIFKTDVYAEKFGGTAFYNTQNYQAIMPIPFFRVGSESHNLLGTDKSMEYAFAFSYHNHIPMLASSAARTPGWEAVTTMQLFSPAFDEKMILKHLPVNKDFLVLYTNEQVPTAQSNFLVQCKLLKEGNNYSILQYNPWYNWKHAATDTIVKFENIKDSLYAYKGFLLDKPDTSGFYYFPLDTFKSAHVFEGKGAYEGKGEVRVIYSDMYLKLDTAKEYVLSFWHYNVDDYNRNGFLFAIEQGDSLKNNKDWKDCITTREVYNVYGDWSLYEYRLKPRFVNGIISLLVYADKNAAEINYDDEIMIRPAGVNVYKPLMINGKKVLLYNNYRIVNPG